MSENRRIQFAPYPEYHGPTVEDVSESWDISDNDDNNEPDDDYDDSSSYDYDDVPRIPRPQSPSPMSRSQSHARHRPTLQSVEAPGFQHNTAPKREATPNPFLAHWADDYSYREGWPPIWQHESSYGQPLVSANGYGFSHVPKQSRESSRVSTIRERTYVPENTIDTSYPVPNVQYAPPPRMSYRPPPPPPPQFYTNDHNTRFHERPTSHPQLSSTYTQRENEVDHGEWRRPKDRPFSEPVITQPPAPGPRAGMRGILGGLGRMNVPQYGNTMGFEFDRQMDARRDEEERRADRKAKQREAERIRVKRQVREEIEAENRAAAQAREAEVKRTEELEKLIQTKVEQGLEGIMMLIQGKLQQEFGTEKQTNTARRERMWAGDQTVMEEAGRQQADKQKPAARAMQQSPSSSRPGHAGHPSESPTSGMNPPHRVPSSEDDESFTQRPPDVPEPPEAYFETDSEMHTTATSSSSRMRRLWRLEQEERSRERKERRSLRTIREELVLPIVETLATGLARAAHGFAPPMPPRFYRPRERGSGFDPAYRRYDSDPELHYSESEYDDPPDTPSSPMEARERTSQSRGRALGRSTERLRRGKQLSSPHKLPIERGEEDIPA
ncbi:hypothetical protein F5Y13DRAFT_187592 [Hypoxylon sp. FL1857]|nr:hypothetical protein F5Y13DRAFT_187592 [Hypoxylon sp. FL1857]